MDLGNGVVDKRHGIAVESRRQEAKEVDFKEVVEENQDDGDG